MWRFFTKHVFTRSKNVQKKPSFLKRDLDARAQSEAVRLTFRLPSDEKLDGCIDCTLMTPYNKKHVHGRMFLSQNYICFASRVSFLMFTFIVKLIPIRSRLVQVKCEVALVIPLRDVKLVEKMDTNSSLNSSLDKAILIQTNMGVNGMHFLFAQILDRDFLVQKLSELLSKTDTPTV